MKYEGDISLYLSGGQVPISECGIFVTQPTVKQIAQFGETDFLTAAQLLSDISSFVDGVKKGNPQLSEFEDFQILLTIIRDDREVRNYIQIFFELICPDYVINFEKNSIDFKITGEDSVKGQINLFNYSSFSKVINELFVLHVDGAEDFDPANDKAKEIADKLKRGRELAKKAKGIESDKRESLFGTYASILAIGMCMDINIFFNYTPFQIYDAFVRYWAKQKSDFYQKITTTPMLDTSKVEEPEEWTKNFY